MADEEFGEERLIKVLRDSQELDLEDASKLLYCEIEKFVGDAPQHDDLTYVFFRFTPEPDGETIIFDIPDDED